MQTLLLLAAPIRRAIGRQQDFSARFGEALDDLLAPDVLADRHAEANAPEGDGARRRPRRENALLVEDAVVGQIDLEAHSLDAAVVEQGDRVVAEPRLDPGNAHQNGGAAIGGFAGEAFQRRPAGFLKRGLEHEVFGRIARQEKLAEHHEVGAESRRPRARVADAGGVARDVADDAVELREREYEAVQGSGGGHGRGLARNAARRNGCRAAEEAYPIASAPTAAMPAATMK